MELWSSILYFPWKHYRWGSMRGWILSWRISRGRSANSVPMAVSLLILDWETHADVQRLSDGGPLTLSSLAQTLLYPERFRTETSYLDGGLERNEDFSTIYYLRIFKKWLRITDLLAELIQVANKFWKANMWKNTTCVFFLYTIELIPTNN